jgi:hypothetical protein
MMAVWASPNVKDRLNEERNEVKVSRSVLESSGSRKRVADFNPLLIGGDTNEQADWLNQESSYLQVEECQLSWILISKPFTSISNSYIAIAYQSWR